MHRTIANVSRFLLMEKRKLAVISCRDDERQFYLINARKSFHEYCDALCILQYIQKAWSSNFVLCTKRVVEKLLSQFYEAHKCQLNFSFPDTRKKA